MWGKMDEFLNLFQVMMSKLSLEELEELCYMVE